MNTRFYSPLVKGIVLALAAAAIAAPIAQGADDGTLLSKAARSAVTASLPSSARYIGGPGFELPTSSVGLPSSGSYIGHPGGPSGVGLVQVLPSAGSYIGHPGGPAGVGPVLSPVAQPQSGFDWADAGVGGGFVAGLVLLTAGAAVMVRRRGVLVAQR